MELVELKREQLLRRLDDDDWFTLNPERHFRLRNRSDKLGEWPPLPPSPEATSYRTLVMKVRYGVYRRFPIVVPLDVLNSEPTDADLFVAYDQMPLKKRMMVAELRRKVDEFLASRG
jgi:hypothetical protein